MYNNIMELEQYMSQLKEDDPKLHGIVNKVLFINNRWIVKGNLSDTANNYVKHLFESSSNLDLKRLEISCERALKIVFQLHPHVPDPKAHFYPALFSLMTEQERSHFLKHHMFCNLSVALIQRKHLNTEQLETLKPSTTQRIYKIASTLKRLNKTQVKSNNQMLML